MTTTSTEALRAWVVQLGDRDANTRALALAGLVRAGPAAAPVLLEALPQTPPPVRALLAQGLAEIAAPGSAEPLAALLDDPDPLVRGRAAQGLAALGDARATAALVRTLDDLPDVLHWPYTVAAYLLIERGPAVLPMLADRLLADDPVSRMRAVEVMRRVLQAQRGEAGWQALVDELGRLDPDAADAAAREVAGRWRRWIAAQGF
jgi:hypothetical protein